MSKTDQMVKIRFRGPHVRDVESLWARPVEGNLYRLDNSPFFAYGVSCQDILEATRGDDEVLDYVGRVRKSGNRTLRVFFRDYELNDERATHVLRSLRELGSSYEGMQPRMISVNVPPKVDLDDVTDFLSQQPGLEWEYADPTYEEVISGRAS